MNKNESIKDKKIKQKVLPVIAELKKLYPNAECSLDYENPLQLLISTRLSAQCTDARVNLVTPVLFARFKTAEDFANAEIEELEEIIKSTGFYHAKAKSIKACGKELVERFNGEVPQTMEELTSLSGVGRKTANLVLGDAFGKPSYVVDTHCIRLTNRIGFTENSDPVKIEMDLRRLIPEEESGRFCHSMVLHGRAVCNARKPRCEECTLSEYCDYYKENKK